MKNSTKVAIVKVVQNNVFDAVRRAIELTGDFKNLVQNKEHLAQILLNLSDANYLKLNSKIRTSFPLKSITELSDDLISA